MEAISHPRWCWPGGWPSAGTTSGCAFVSYTRAPNRTDKSPESDFIRDWEARTPIEALDRTQARVMFGPALAYARDVLADLEREPADALAINRTLYGGMIAA